MDGQGYNLNLASDVESDQPTRRGPLPSPFAAREMIAFKLTVAEKMEITAIAEQTGMTVSEVCREATLKFARWTARSTRED